MNNEPVLNITNLIGELTINGYSLETANIIKEQVKGAVALALVDFARIRFVSEKEMTREIAFNHVAQYLSVNGKEPSGIVELLGYSGRMWTYHELKEFLLK